MPQCGDRILSFFLKQTRVGDVTPELRKDSSQVKVSKEYHKTINYNIAWMEAQLIELHHIKAQRCTDPHSNAQISSERAFYTVGASKAKLQLN